MGESREGRDVYARVHVGEGICSGKRIILVERGDWVYGFTESKGEKCTEFDRGERYSCLGVAKSDERNKTFKMRGAETITIMEGEQKAQVVDDLIEVVDRRGGGPSLRITAHLTTLLGEEE